MVLAKPETYTCGACSTSITDIKVWTTIAASKYNVREKLERADETGIVYLPPKRPVSRMVFVARRPLERAVFSPFKAVCEYALL